MICESYEVISELIWIRLWAMRDFTPRKITKKKLKTFMSSVGNFKLKLLKNSVLHFHKIRTTLKSNIQFPWHLIHFKYNSIEFPEICNPKSIFNKWQKTKFSTEFDNEKFTT